ncbi:MAG: TraM recognition domain-containing protein [Acidobacteria bacterium]|nr:TraM recognition domain-containing protein [Acidobacteriota bacterium]MCY3971587.1 TraM recognition domain-containing protein [Acidobacteriota bacterium]
MGVGVLLLTLRFAAWPSPGSVAWLDSLALRTHLDFAVLRAAWWATLAAALIVAVDLVPVAVRRILDRGGRVAGAGVHRRLGRLVRALRGILTLRLTAALAAGIGAFRWAGQVQPFPAIGDDPLLDFIQYHDPTVHALFRAWHQAAPGVVAFGGVLLLSGAARVWLGSRTESASRGRGVLPAWPASTDDQAPSLVLGELHHPIEAREASRPRWLSIPERGLYTGVAIFGAVGTGKTSGCMRPFAEQLFSWQAHHPQRRAAGLVLEVKGDFCHDIRQLLADNGREDDYVEIALGGRWQWNPLDSDMDSYSLAYTLANLLNQLFGKSKDPFWHQASTNLVRWIIELHRVFPDPWVTLRDVYRLTIDARAFQTKITAARTLCEHPASEPRIRIAAEDVDHPELPGGTFKPGRGGGYLAADSPELTERLDQLGVSWEPVAPRAAPPDDRLARLEAVNRWYQKDWLTLDNKLRSSIVENISVFLSVFDLPDVARLFAPPSPHETPAANTPNLPATPGEMEQTGPETGPSDADRAERSTQTDGRVAGGMLAPLPPLADLIEGGKVVALNMPAGANPSLARAVGVLLKNAWLQTLLRRPAQMKRNPDRYFRPAVFLCDEYQSFATVGEDDPSGDEKSFALTRQCKCIPIVATQSIASLRSVLAGNDAWRTLLQTLRTRIFLTLSDDSSSDLASNMCGKVSRLSPSYSFSESSKPGFSLVTARPGGGQGGSLGASKTYREQREPMFHPRTFTLLQNYQAIALPYDGSKSLPATRLYLKPHYLPHDRSYWRQRDAGEI